MTVGWVTLFTAQMAYCLPSCIYIFAFRDPQAVSSETQGAQRAAGHAASSRTNLVPEPASQGQSAVTQAGKHVKEHQWCGNICRIYRVARIYGRGTESGSIRAIDVVRTAAARDVGALVCVRQGRAS